ncbi:hypothetical protein [Streptomyces sp. CC224B]|uniref:hypothetical protein n=1 Tax=Streptomyces sp. CC224B TaxID=3044571 RepID=UPI0024A9D540|nr:hypothetical protein [Streptomyces sp. CC224B]
MPKDSRARTQAVRAVMAETGLPYTRAALELDRRTGAAGQRLNFIPFVLAFTVPATADRRELAQSLADQLQLLRRRETGEEYEGRADVIVPGRPWAPEPGLPGHVAGILLVRAWAVRPWDRGGEWEAVVTDFHAAASAWLLDRYPGPGGGQPAVLPLGTKDAQALAATADFTAHTEGEHAELPGGWDELIAARRAEADAPGSAAPASAAGDLEPITLASLIRMVPSAPGGSGKTSATYLRDSQGDLTHWVSGTPAVEPGPVERPYRVVDREFQGWYRRSGDGLYDADRGHARGLEAMSYEELDAARGPLRPVQPPSREDCDAVKAALAGAGRKAAASLLVALFRLVEQDARAGRSAGAKNWLIAGREGSHESAALDRLAWGIGGDLDEKPKRYDAAAVAELMRVIGGWVSGPDRYVEVAANLAFLFSSVADEAGGWSAVADQYLQRHQRVGTPDHVVEAVQLYLMSASRTPVFE